MAICTNGGRRVWVHRMVAAGVALASATAYAQPGATPEAPSQPQPPPPPDGAPPMSVVGAPVVAGATDSPELRAEYDRAFSLLLKEQWEAAATALNDIATRSVEPDRRASARELARFAHEMDTRGESGPKRSSGRASFVATTTLASFYAGFVIDDLGAVDDYKNQTMVVTGVTFAGFGASLYGSSGRRITSAMASAYGSGLLVGMGNGLFFAPRLGIDVDGEPGDGSVNDKYLGFGLATMAAGGAAGLYLADRFDPTPAQAQYAGLMAVNGLATMGLGLVIIQPDKMDYRNVLALLGVGLDAGAVGGMVLGHDLTWSTSRLTYVELSEFLGGLTGVAVTIVALDPNNSDNGARTGGALVLAGIWGGYALAQHLTSDMAPDPRYRQGAPTVTLVPVLNQHTQGLALAGTF